MKKQLRNIMYGFWSWLIPFVASIPFYSRDGQLLIDVRFFKSIMMAVGSVSAALLLVLFFKKISANYLKESIVAGLTWLGVNLILDLLILVPMSKMPLAAYFSQIGLSYLAIPAISIAMGIVLANKK